MPDLLTFPWVSFALVGRTEAAAGEHGHPDEGFGAVVAVGPFRQCPDVGVCGFRPGVGDVVVECVLDQRAVSFDCAAELFELCDATVASPEDPAGQQGMSLGAFARNTSRSCSLSR